jgi:surface polysaccharide O-acyltransferase-like enzyme
MDHQTPHANLIYDPQSGASTKETRRIPNPKMDTGMIDKRTSEKITLTVLLATIAVVVRHSYNAHIYRPNVVDIGPYDISSFVQLLNRHTTASAVPMFFLLSGYLFFRNFDIRRLLRKWNSRLHSLVIPYLLWNALYLVFLFLIVPHVAFLGRFSDYDPLTVSLGTILERLTIDPPSSHFWFVRDLIGFVILAPLFYLAFQNRWLAGIALMALLVYWRPVDRSILSSEGLLFFFAGGWAGHQRLDLRRLRIDPLWITGTVCVLWLGLCVCQTLWLSEGPRGALVTKAATLMGVAVLWLLVDRIGTLSIRDRLLQLAPYTFFIYASHTPMVRYVYKVLLSLVSESQYYALLVYVATPAITTAISVCAARLICRYGGGIYPVLTGGRVPPNRREYACTASTVTQPT